MYIGETSNFLTEVFGADALRVTMPPSKAYSAMVTKEQALADVRYDKSTNYHGLGIDGLVKVLEASEDPVAAFADTGDEKSKRSGNIVLVTDEVGADGNIVVVEALDAKGYLKGKKIEANKVITSFDRDAVANDILQAAIDGRLLHLDKKRSQTILAGVPAANSQIAIQGVDFRKNTKLLGKCQVGAGRKSTVFICLGSYEGDIKAGFLFSTNRAILKKTEKGGCLWTTVSNAEDKSPTVSCSAWRAA